jgi:hypothetical protein
MMNVTILREAGYAEAALGLALSFEREADDMPRVMRRLYNKDGGHNKFLESMIVWLDVTAPRHFWQQFDTYRAGMTKQSCSTMHTATKRQLTQDDFDRTIPRATLEQLNYLIACKDLMALKNELPEGYLQRRLVCTNYKTLRAILWQRRTHRNPAWGVFCAAVLEQVEHKEFFEDLA